MIALSLRDPQKCEITNVPRWIVSALLILALHASAVMVLVTWQRPARPVLAAPVAIMVDLAPIPEVSSMPPQPPPPPTPIVQSEPLPPAPAPVVAMPPKPPQRRPAQHPVPLVRQPEPAPMPQPAQAERAPGPVAPTRTQPAPAPDKVSDYEKLLFEHLERQKRFPRSARLRGEEGTVLVRFAMNRDGTVLSARIERSSGYRDLDDEVLSLIARAQPLPPFPGTMTQARLELVVPVRFTIQ